MDKLYCLNCKSLTKHTPKLSAIMEGKMVCTVCSTMNGLCQLTKVDDERFIKTSKDFKWVEFENHRGKDLHDTPKVGYSLLMSPFNPYFFTWQTTEIVELISVSDNEVNFKTKNSHYILKFNKDLIEKYGKK